MACDENIKFITKNCFKRKQKIQAVGKVKNSRKNTYISKIKTHLES